jgi:hypothetical protein
MGRLTSVANASKLATRQSRLMARTPSIEVLRAGFRSEMLRVPIMAAVLRFREPALLMREGEKPILQLSPHMSLLLDTLLAFDRVGLCFNLLGCPRPLVAW